MAQKDGSESWERKKWIYDGWESYMKGERERNNDKKMVENVKKAR